VDHISVVLFEDHTWRHFRPVSASQPVYELRCGMFSLRERCELLGARPRLLCRRILGALGHAGVPTATRSSAATSPATELWLSGRLLPSTAAVAAIDKAFAAAPGAWWFDQDGLLAAAVTADQLAGAQAAWEAWERGAATRWDSQPAGPFSELAPAPGQRLLVPVDAGDTAAGTLAAALTAATNGAAPALARIWEIVPATPAAIRDDLTAAQAAGSWVRRPFGLFAGEPEGAPWAAPTRLTRATQAHLPQGCWLQGDDLWLAAGVTLAPGCVIDARRGPVILDNGVDVAPHTLLEGPLYLGPACRVKAGARLYGESSFGIGNRLAGEIGESTFGDFTNKQHEGFIGHAVLGSWVNLGAMTTCSDLKNNYGNVRVDLGSGSEDTKQRFVGLLAGDHVKTAIGTLFNTGTSVGFASNIFGGGMPPKCVPAFSWGGSEGAPAYGVEQAIATAAVVMGRRGCRFEAAHQAAFEFLAAGD
jgi:UDP-N-acetylglucosamine diphosphorylase/glucosamine-1-phosphate N-acetyltransferase